MLRDDVGWQTAMNISISLENGRVLSPVSKQVKKLCALLLCNQSPTQLLRYRRRHVCASYWVRSAASVYIGVIIV